MVKLSKGIFLSFILLWASVMLDGNAQVFFNADQESKLGALKIVKVTFPKVIGIGNTASGALQFKNAKDGLRKIRFDVVDGRYQRVDARTFNGAESGQVRFSLACSDFSQTVTLRVSIEDRGDRSSEPTLLQFTCGRPELFNFSDELANKRPMTDWVRLHFFILEDGVTALADNSVQLTTPLFKQPEPLVIQAIHQVVVPALNGIWDQCALAFKSGIVRVLDPQQLKFPGGNLAKALFQRKNGKQVVVQGVGRSSLSQAYRQLQLALRPERVELGIEDLVIFISGLPILTPTQSGSLAKVEGISESSLARFALVRWGAVYQQDANITLPKQMVTTLAHEVGHLLGLSHPGSDGLPDSATDHFNLMKGSGVAPEPRAHLLAGQCQQARAGLAQLRFRAQALKNAPDPARTSSTSDGVQAKTSPAPPPAASPTPPALSNTQKTVKPSVRWDRLKVERKVKGKVVLRLAVSGFKDLANFGFAEFSYSSDGVRFTQIGFDRTPSDGFSAMWDVSKLHRGRYQLKATVMDATRQQAEATVWVRIR